MVPFISKKDIEKAADKFRAAHNNNGTIPIPLEDIVEFDLGISFTPERGLMTTFGIDGFFAQDFSTIYIDEGIFLNSQNRARFTIAHELGHLCLHKSYIQSLQIGSIRNWKEVILTKGKDHDRLEVQANIFAGYLLVPTAHLEQVNQNLCGTLPKELGNLAPGILAPYLANEVAKHFEVSPQVAEIRLQALIADKGKLF